MRFGEVRRANPFSFKHLHRRTCDQSCTWASIIKLVEEWLKPYSFGLFRPRGHDRDHRACLPVSVAPNFVQIRRNSTNVPWFSCLSFDVRAAFSWFYVFWWRILCEATLFAQARTRDEAYHWTQTAWRLKAIRTIKNRWRISHAWQCSHDLVHNQLRKPIHRSTTTMVSMSWCSYRALKRAYLLLFTFV
jgi:hypothetical protein